MKTPNLISAAGLSAAALLLTACSEIEAADSSSGSASEARAEARAEAQARADRMEEAIQDGALEDDAAAEEGAYGSDPTLDALQDSCEDGDVDACDELYWESPLDSEYEATAERHGGGEDLEDEVEPDPGPQWTVAQDNAVGKAQEYLDYSAFSRSGLINQLKYEGFSAADAEFGVDQVPVNWRNQAAKKAQEYLDYSSFSRSGLIQQLQYEGFTPAQAEHGVNQTGLR